MKPLAWILGAASVVLLVLESDGFDLGGIVFIALVGLWVLAPWALLGSSLVPLTTVARGVAIAMCAVLAVLAFKDVDDSSTGALAFLVIPVVQAIVVGAVALADGLASRLRSRRA